MSRTPAPVAIPMTAGMLRPQITSSFVSSGVRSADAEGGLAFGGKALLEIGFAVGTLAVEPAARGEVVGRANWARGEAVGVDRELAPLPPSDEGRFEAAEEGLPLRNADGGELGRALVVGSTLGAELSGSALGDAERLGRRLGGSDGTNDAEGSADSTADGAPLGATAGLAVSTTSATRSADTTAPALL